MRQFIENYKGVSIIYSCGFYYPDINGNIECSLIGDVRHWIDMYTSIPSDIRNVIEILSLV